MTVPASSFTVEELGIGHFPDQVVSETVGLSASPQESALNQCFKMRVLMGAGQAGMKQRYGGTFTDTRSEVKGLLHIRRKVINSGGNQRFKAWRGFGFSFQKRTEKLFHIQRDAP